MEAFEALFIDLVNKKKQSPYREELLAEFKKDVEVFEILEIEYELERKNMYLKAMIGVRLEDWTTLDHDKSTVSTIAIVGEAMHSNPVLADNFPAQKNKIIKFSRTHKFETIEVVKEKNILATYVEKKSTTLQSK